MKRKMAVMVIVIRPPSFGLTSIVVVVALCGNLEAHPKIHRDHRVPCLTLVKPTPREGAL